MSEDETKIHKAADILKIHRVGKIAEDLLNQSYRFQSMPAVTLTRCTKLSCVANDVSGVILTYDDHELAVVTTDFKISSAPDISTFYADGVISYDSELVLKVTATEEYDEYGGSIQFDIYAQAIKSMKAGPWLEMMGSCYDMLQADANRREDEARIERDRKQASDIDLGEY